MNPAKTIPLAVALLTACAETTSARNDDRPLVIAHRGASFLAPEHTIAAYDRAIADGADYIELDLARTSDGAVVVIHDSSLDRTARGPVADCRGEVRDKTYAQLLRCDFGAWFNEQYPVRARNEYRGLRILTLEEVIARYRDRAGLYIEIKTPELYPGIESRLAATLRSSGLTGGKRPAVVQSFNVQSLLTLRDIDPSILLVILSGTDILPDLSQLRRFATGLGVPAPAVSAELVRLAHDQCIAVFPYGGDSRLSELIELGVDGIFTDTPDLLRNIVDESSRTVPDFSSCSTR